MVVRVGSPSLTRISRYDRYRNFLKGSWKDTASPGTGLVYDLGTHLIDQALHSFGRPAKITAFLQNLRGIGDDSVDDNVSKPHLPRSRQR
jgi:predicted dehydrogenase